MSDGKGDPTLRYQAAAHRVQTAIAALIAVDQAPQVSPKRLRVGLDLEKAEAGGLARLIAKGVFSQAEYAEAMAAAVEAEADTYEAHVSAVLGAKVTLA